MSTFLLSSAFYPRPISDWKSERGYRFHYSLDIPIRSLPVADTDAHGATATPGGAAKNAFTGLWVAAMTGWGSIIIALLNEPAEANGSIKPRVKRSGTRGGVKMWINPERAAIGSCRGKYFSGRPIKNQT
jgi:hypothetical protein